VLVEQPRLAATDVHRLEDPVAAEDAEVVGAQDRDVGRHHAPAEDGDYPLIGHARSLARGLPIKESASKEAAVEGRPGRGPATGP
jgi:hypothetical protein